MRRRRRRAAGDEVPGSCRSRDIAGPSASERGRREKMDGRGVEAIEDRTADRQNTGENANDGC